MGFDDQEVGVLAPHNSARARVLHSDPDRTRLRSSRMKMSALTHRELTWKDTNASVRARGYNKSSACMCASRRATAGREEDA